MDPVLDFSLMEAAAATQGNLPGPQIAVVYKWLDAFQKDPARRIALDSAMSILARYDALFGSKGNFALRIVQDKLDKGAFRRERVIQNGEGEVLLGSHWHHLDNDRRWLAGIAARRPEVAVANATYRGWHKTAMNEACTEVRIDQVLDAWLDEQVSAEARAANSDTAAHYHTPPQYLSGMLASALPVGVGTNDRKAWETASHRYEWDRQHGTVEEYSMSGVWQREARPDGTTTKTSYSGPTRKWGR